MARRAVTSPFPGMDPYIETPDLWPDFHADLAAEIRARLNPNLQPDYYARLTPYVTYDVIEIARTQFFTVEIHESDTGALVTAIEILSPVNKRSGHEARADYLRKRRELLRSAAHVMEIDLLRAGERSPLDIPVPDAPYYVTLSRANARPAVEVWPIQLTNRLPVIPVPLTEPDPDVPLDLGAVVASVYERGAYGVQIDYRLPPPPPALAKAESVWLETRWRELAVR